MEMLVRMVGMAVRNIARHRLRSGLTLAAIAFGVAGLVLSGGFVQDVFFQLGEAVIRSQTGHLQIAQTGFFTYGSRSPDRFIIQNAEGTKRRIAMRPEVAQVMGRLEFSALLGNGRTDLPVRVEGIEPDKEASLGSYMVIRSGRRLESGDRHGLLVGEGLANALHLRVGDSVTLVTSAASGAMNSLDFNVAGVFQSYSKEFDASVVKIALPAAQELFGTTGVNALVIELVSTRDTERAANALRNELGASGLEVLTWKQLNDFYEKTVTLYDRQFGVLRLIVLFMVLLSVSNTVNMSLFERIAEFGTMRALGDRSRKIFGLVMTEALALGVIGAALGVVVGIAAAILFSAGGIPMPPPPNSNLGYTAQIRIVPVELAGAATVGLFATLLAALLPARRVSRLPIAEALRRSV